MSLALCSHGSLKLSRSGTLAWARLLLQRRGQVHDSEQGRPGWQLQRQTEASATEPTAYKYVCQDESKLSKRSLETISWVYVSAGRHPYSMQSLFP